MIPGCLIKRARKASARDASGEVVAFPRLDHPRAGLSVAAWRALSPGEKLERPFGMSLDRMAEIPSWPVRIGARPCLEAHCQRERSAALEALARDLRARRPAGAASEA
jgi:hypothetical protein